MRANRFLKSLQPAAGRTLLLASRDVALAEMVRFALTEPGCELAGAEISHVAVGELDDKLLESCTAVILDARDEHSVASASARAQICGVKNLIVLLIVSDDARAEGLQAIMAGAQDMIVESELCESRLQSTLDCALVRRRVSRRIARQSGNDRLPNALTVDQSATSASLYGLGTLEKTLPEDHRFLIAEYAGILAREIDSLGLEATGDKEKSRLLALVERLGALGATPPDLVRIHTQALNKICDGSDSVWQDSVAAEARFLLLEALGYLVYYYRRYSVHQTST